MSEFKEICVFNGQDDLVLIAKPKSGKNYHFKSAACSDAFTAFLHEKRKEILDVFTRLATEVVNE